MRFRWILALAAMLGLAWAGTAHSVDRSPVAAVPAPDAPVPFHRDSISIRFLGDREAMPALDAVVGLRAALVRQEAWNSVSRDQRGPCSVLKPGNPKLCSTTAENQLCSVKDGTGGGQCSAHSRNPLDGCSAIAGGSTDKPAQCSVMGASTRSSCSAFGNEKPDNNCSAGLGAGDNHSCSVYSGGAGGNKCSAQGTYSACSTGEQERPSTSGSCSVYGRSERANPNTCSAYGNNGDYNNSCSTFGPRPEGRPATTHCSVAGSSEGSASQCSSMRPPPTENGAARCSVLPWKNQEQPSECSVRSTSEGSTGECSVYSDTAKSQCSVIDARNKDHFCSVEKDSDAKCTILSSSSLNAKCSVITGSNSRKVGATCSVKGGTTYDHDRVRECRGRSK